MERRVLLAVTLSFLVLFIYQGLFVRPAQKSAQKAGSKTSVAQVAGGGAPAAGETATAAPAAEAAAGLPAGPEAATVVGDSEDRDVVVENAEVRAVFSSRGAALKSWRLKRFFDDRRQPIDLVPDVAPAQEAPPFALTTGDAALDTRLRTALYKPSAPGLQVGDTGGEMVFEFADDSGLSATKRFRFGDKAQPFTVTFSADVTREGTPVPVSVESGAGLGDIARSAASGQGGFFSPSYYQKPEAIFHKDGKVQRVVSASLATQASHDGRFVYIGADDQYFLSVLLPGDRSTRVRYRVVPVTTPVGPVGLVAYQAGVDGPTHDFKYFLGPKEFDDLAATDRELVRVINFGMFSFLVVPLLRSLNWVNGFVGNYGWSIIILTILINAAMFPLRHKSVVSMRKLQDLQPEVKAIQDRYAKLKATDPARQKMNTELMNLYRERGVNPASGCVPMLLTLPVLFAFYSLLSQAIEIRDAPFFGWIKDLSTFDPWYVTPLLMGATMVWQQRITPSTADPTQQKVMMFMPIMFTFMFLWAPSGLVIYWFVSNLWAIGQQYLTNSLIGPPKARAEAPAVRRLKKTSADEGADQ